MASRQSTLFNMDGGYWFKLDGGQGAAVSLSVAATRYTNLNDFQTIVPIATWNPNQWNDQQRLLNDSKYGFKIRENIFTTDLFAESPINDSALSPYSTGGDPNILDRESVLFSLAQGQYIYLRPGWESEDPAQVQFAYVPSHQQATRFSNLLPLEALLDGSMLGDDPFGYMIEQYYFTKDIEPVQYNYSSGGPTGQRDIQRASVPFSKQDGQYLVIDDTGLPPIDMTFTFTSDAWSGTRFANVNDFKTIVDATYLSGIAYGWELPQFYFNRATRPPKGNPFQVFWCDEQQGPYNCIGYEMVTCDWICRIASMHPFNFREFLNQVAQYLLTPKCYPDERAFEAWWGQQDYGAFEQWLYDFWVSCGGQG
jgi:hypothetical protein